MGHDHMSWQRTRVTAVKLFGMVSILVGGVSVYGAEVHNIERAGVGPPMAVVFLDNVSAPFLVPVLRPLLPRCAYLAGVPRQNAVIISAPKERLTLVVYAVLEIDLQPSERSPTLQELRSADRHHCSESDRPSDLTSSSETTSIELLYTYGAHYGPLLRPLLRKTATMSVLQGRLYVTDSPARNRSIEALIRILDVDRKIDRSALRRYEH